MRPKQALTTLLFMRRQEFMELLASEYWEAAVGMQQLAAAGKTGGEWEEKSNKRLWGLTRRFL